MAVIAAWMIPPLKMDVGGGLDGIRKSPYLVPKISAKTKSPHLHKGVTKMFYMNPFRRLENEIERLEDSTRPKYNPNATCIDCKHLIVKEHICFGDMYYCELNNNCEGYTLKV